MAKEMQFPEGFYWGEKAWHAFARPCLMFLEVMNKNVDKVYRTCKVLQQRV
ncbi:hypothetical protein KC722_01505 [Candidatus Kaiserbacteria bacterium]|nr:hypothetical protein [Candidatus Kaiserbacteria bacterium]MCB9812007.1 hypothetical protein [Candidatus Nomurabacteria bacterium]